MARLALERGEAAVGEVLAGDWEALLPSVLAAWGEEAEELAAGFEAHRAGAMAGDRAGWVALNAPYPGVGDALARWGCVGWGVGGGGAAPVSARAAAAGANTRNPPHSLAC